MSHGHLRDDDLIDLAHGLRGVEEAPELIDHLRSCAPCEERLRELGADRESIRLDLYLAWTPGRMVVRRRSSRMRLWTVAAGLLLATVGGVVVTTSLQRSAPAGYWFPDDMELVVQRGDGDSRIRELREAIALYDRRELGRARRMLESVSFPPEFEAIRDLYLASAVQLDGDPARAREILATLEIETLPPPWFARAHRVLYDACSGLECARETRTIPALLQDDPELGGWARDALEQQRSGHRGEPSSTNPAQ